MDLVRPHVLKQITLRHAAEGRDTIYLAQDRANDRIFVLKAESARALRRLLRAALHPSAPAREAARADADPQDARNAMAALQMIHGARLHELTHRKPFNPIFAAIPLFDAGRLQPWLTGLARYAGGPVVLAAFALLLMAFFWLGARNDWQIMQAFSTVFSLQALLTFGLIAPFLKIIHELGHILVATRYGVRVKKAGLYVIGLYPMPFVDCSQADMTATRAQRVAISGAGIITDLLVGLIAFVLWHLVEGDYLRSLLANIFVFSTLNSILFNGNPLIRLDGYYVFSDAIGQRNLGTRATNVLRSLRRWIASFGAEGHVPRGGEWALAGYGVAAFGYRINILVVIAAALLPAYLGLGAAVVIWGGFVMFLSPLMRSQPPAAGGAKGRAPGRAAAWWLGSAVVVALVLAFVRWPVIVSAPMTLDADGRYHLTAQGGGTIVQLAGPGPMREGDLLARLAHPALEADLSDLRMDIALATQLMEAVSGLDPARAIAATRQVEGLTERLAVLEREREGLTLSASSGGVFIPVSPLHSGSWVQPGALLGTWYPHRGAAVFSGPFPEHFYTVATQSEPRVTLRLGRADYVDLPASAIELREIITHDLESGARSLRILVSLPGETPADLAGTTAHLRLRYPPEPLWQHLGYFWSRLSARFYEAQISDRSSLL